MQLDALAISLRPRNHWEALDLGVLLVRRWWRTLYLCWLATALPTLLLLGVLLSEHPLLALLIFWWLKPVYERAPLLFLSRAIFGEVPDRRTLARELPRVLRAEMLQRLTLRRLSPARSFETPVALLEQLTGERRRRRLAVLQRTAGTPAFWLTVIGVHVEGFMQISMLLLVVVLVPAEMDVDWLNLLLARDTAGLDWASNAAYFIAAGAVAPVYVAGGFSLYLNRRVELEGWDIELRFRELARRVAGGAGLVLALTVFGSDAAHAEALEDPAASQAMIGEILDGEAFHQQSVMSVPRFLESWFDEERQRPEPVDLDWLEPIGKIIALIAEVALWVGAGVVLVLLALWLSQYRLPGVEPPRRRVAAARVQTLDLDAPDLEGDAIARARGYWSSARRREAVALLYRWALVRLRDRFGVPIEAGDTEGECWAKARGTVPNPLGDLVGRLTRTWLAAGYGHRLPGESEFASLAEHCEDLLRDHPGGQGDDA